MQFRRVIDYLEGICILHNDPGIAQNLEITEQKSELTITKLTAQWGKMGGHQDIWDFFQFFQLF